MFERLNQFVDYKFQKLGEEISQLKARMDLHYLTTPTQHVVQDPLTSIMNNISTKIKNILNKGIEDITFEVKAQAFKIIKLEDCRRYEDEYATNLGILHAEFGRVRGSTDNFAKLQANALKGLWKDTKQVTSELELVWHFLQRIMSIVQSQACFSSVIPNPTEPKQDDSSENP